MTQDRPGGFVRCVALVTTICFFSSACVVSRVLREDFHQPSSGDKLPLKVALRLDKSAMTEHLRVDFPIPTGVTQFDIGAELLNATKSELDSVFEEVTIARDSTQSKGQDFLVVVSPQCLPPCTKPAHIRGSYRRTEFGIALDFQDPRSGRTILKFKRREELPRIRNWLFFLEPLIPFSLFMSGVNSYRQANKLEKQVEKALSDSLRSISGQIRRSNLAALKEVQDRAGEAEKKGDSARKAGNSRAALDQYMIALQDARLGSEVDLRVREKYLGLAVSMGYLSKVPEEMRQHMARGQAWPELEKAAPWWVQAYFNLAVMQEWERNRTRILKIMFKAAIKLKPRVSEEAKRFAIRGQSRFKTSKSKDDYALAVEELMKAVRAAPWWPEAYFNLALVQEKAGQPTAAIRNLKLYMAAKPGAGDAEAVKRKIIELELALETK